MQWTVSPHSLSVRNPALSLTGYHFFIPVMKTSHDPELSLLMTIEEAIKRFFQENPHLRDTDVIKLLETLSLRPEAVPTVSSVQYPLSMSIDSNLRLQLSMRAYTRQEVRQALRKILRSAIRHHKQEGERGYLTFISFYLP